MNEYNKAYFTHVSEKTGSVYMQYHDFLMKRGIDTSEYEILDFGCATGLASHIFPFKTYHGVDISSYAISQAMQHNTQQSVTFDQIDIDTHDYQTSRYDLILCFDVIEHVRNLDSFKRFLDQSLRIGGRLVITTPNAQSLLRFIKGKQATSVELDPTHVMTFTPYSLDFMMERMGLEPLGTSTPYSFYFEDNAITTRLPFGGQIFGVYEKK